MVVRKKSGAIPLCVDLRGKLGGGTKEAPVADGG